MEELIKRQAAIDAFLAAKVEIDEFCTEFDEGFNYGMDYAVSVAATLAEQPDIIRCKDCVHWLADGCKDVGCKENDFCSYAERRSNG